MAGSRASTCTGDEIGTSPPANAYWPWKLLSVQAWGPVGLLLRSQSNQTSGGAVARGEEVFNTTKIDITGVAGRNDVLNLPSIAGFCGTCHDTPNVDNHSVKAPLNIGIADDRIAFFV
jgi:cytochrome c peroxidase